LVKTTLGEQLSHMKVLDLNTDTGRLAFELAPYVKELMALDFSARFIRMPDQLLDKGFIRYIVQDESELLLYHDVELKKLGLGAGIERIKFMQDNANNLKPLFSGYDLIILPNVLEEIECPKKFLLDIHSRINPGGWLVIASDYDWDAQQVAYYCRPGGFKADGEPVTSLQGITNLLRKKFVKVGDNRELIRYERFNSRKMLVRRCEVTFWKLV
jgi:putative 4-mercaptohistidine N1-methyltranferase